MSHERLIRFRLTSPKSHHDFIKVVFKCAATCGYHFITPEIEKPFNIKLSGHIQYPKDYEFERFSFTQFQALNLNQYGSYTLEAGKLIQRRCDASAPAEDEFDWRWTLDVSLHNSEYFSWVQFWFRDFFVPAKVPHLPEPMSDLWDDLLCDATEYYFIRCLYRALNAKTVHSGNYYRGHATHPQYVFRRNSRRSKIIPAFEEYCRQVGFACVDDLDSPVLKVPDFVPTGPVFAAIGSVDDLTLSRRTD